MNSILKDINLLFEIHTQEYMGRNELVNRLTAQLGGNRELAIRILTKRGHYDISKNELTKLGKIRDNMTAEERALDRVSKQYNRPIGDFIYNPKTNRAILKHGAYTSKK